MKQFAKCKVRTSLVLLWAVHINCLVLFFNSKSSTGHQLSIKFSMVSEDDMKFSSIVIESRTRQQGRWSVTRPTTFRFQCPCDSASQKIHLGTSGETSKTEEAFLHMAGPACTTDALSLTGMHDNTCVRYRVVPTWNGPCDCKRLQVFLMFRTATYWLVTKIKSKYKPH